ncbi:F-box/kelch-repeat protein At3g06240-like [Juglans microcarpa x Juglans regia]|uniref:F-box/kelch-repeat protein At3g06240-like n=1 Tax=Juglans microcarpa x Juglans regia TaxID=2249226 RepID=UPI001B7E1AE2|nr:F-box/kelch-repeat protein At3g06240-like [Juglans microcarpa x Juglans regia]
MLIRNLPEDVVMEILSRLPVESLMRFKCVNKAWYFLIRNPDFIAKHLFRATSDKRHRGFLLNREHEITRTPWVSLHSYETLAVSRYVDLLQFFPRDVGELVVFGPCNGILCLFGVPAERNDGDDDRGPRDGLVLWNPATRESKALPIIQRPAEMPTTFSFCFGFGLDPNTGDLKVIRILNFNFLRCQVEVYNLSTDSWRVINTSVNPNYRINSPRFPSYLNGVHYWWACERGGSGHRLMLSFDMSNEVFQEIALPPLTKRPSFEAIAVINDSVALILVYNDLARRFYDICVMNESGGEKTWTLMFTIGPRPHFSSLIELRDDGFVLVRNKNGWLVLYDPRTQEQRELPIYGDSFQVVSYTETLVMLNGSGSVLVEHEDYS